MSVECVSEATLRSFEWRGYQVSHPKADVLDEIAQTRLAFERTRGVPADICITAQSVAERIPEGVFAWVRWWGKCDPTVWYLGNTASAL